ncbi:glycosyltransferase [uncultured Parabacteroides sp.]|uniref:glycosyltransferase family 2 protein n=1 Tax=uncultured Parabacteroides sp. TaxID=512312 RepID=UPI002596A4D7|nr:glycosyltransferase [uncultured Parabacteroides sp.]
MNNPLVSIIIPVYNVENFLTRCLNSILVQTYENIEVLLVDDGSTDSSGEICDKFVTVDSRIIVFHKKNGGVSTARNLGIEHAKGDYICFVDSDDTVEPDMIQYTLQNAFVCDADISCCLLDVVEIDGSIRFITKGNSGFRKNTDIIALYFTDQFIKDQMYGVYNKLFKSTIVKNKTFKPYKLGEDILFMFEVLLCSNNIYIGNKVGYHYLHRVGSAMTSVFSEKRLDYIFAAKEIVKLCKGQAPYVLDVARSWLFYHYLITLRKIITNNSKRQFSTFYNEGIRYLRENKVVLKGFGFMRKLDYIGILYFPVYFRLLKLIRL